LNASTEPPHHFKKLRIAIATTTRFHVLNLAEELAQLGHEVTFYTMTPRHILRQHYTANIKINCFFVYLWPLIAVSRLTSNHHLRAFINEKINKLCDFLTALFLKECDVLIGMSGIALQSSHKARQKFRAKIIIERSSTHIQNQAQIISQLHALFDHTPPISAATIERELASYEIADYIATPSQFCVESFIEHGVDPAKVFKNPFGVDLRYFRPQSCSSSKPTAIIVGNWSLRKGCHMLKDIWPLLKTAHPKLLHVGSIGDADFPHDHPDFHHYQKVSQNELHHYYQKAHVQLMFSLEEGLPVVLFQGLVSGLVLVCSLPSGGSDLQQFTPQKERIITSQSFDLNEMAQCIDRAFSMAMNQDFKRLDTQVEGIQWRDYAKRYDSFIHKILD
jgi:alpha-maltose-1-phosphate synthase